MRTSTIISRITKSFSLVLVIGMLYPIASCAQQSDGGEFLDLLAVARKHTADRNWGEAVAAWRQVTERNPVNGQYVASLGEALYFNGQYEKAIEAYKKQIDRKFGSIFIAAYNVACCYALIGNKDQALNWLEKSFALGFRSYTYAQNDSDLKSLHGDKRFIRIVAMEDVSKMTRTQGWRYDMELLKKEVMRKAYLRRDLPLDAFNKQYQVLYNSIDKKTDMQMIMELLKLMVNVNDGHSALFPFFDKQFKMSVPLQFYLFKEGLYIVAAHEKYKDLVGRKVLMFEKKTVEEVSATLSPYIARDNEIGVLQNLQSYMRHTRALHALGLIADENKMGLRLIDAAGKQSNVVVVADTMVARVDHKSVPADWVKYYQTLSQPVPLYLKNTKTNYWFEKLPNSKALYFQWNNVLNDRNVPLTRFTDSLMKYISDNDIEKLVIDLRWNNGGNTMLLPYFINAIIKND
ncbi:MAG TPA: tetratricopeptide repeat protein, partial [Chitinophagaceae bacterium]